MIHPIINHRMLSSTSSAFIEGASSTESKITAFVIGVFVSLASCFLFPAEGALIISVGTVALLSFCNCLPSGSAAEEEQPRWYHPIIQAVPVFFPQNVVPVRNPGIRVHVGGQGYYQPAPVAPRVLGRFNQGQHVPVGRGHGQVGLNPEEGRVQQLQPQPAARPAIHPEPPNRNPPLGRVPVGNGHRRL
jgi:hypothetical protein